MKKPRLIYYNDGHHFHAKRVDPPLNQHKMHWPVDEVVGTGVELLVLGLGYGDVYFHDSKVGRTVDEEKQVWENFIDWRIMRMVKDAREMGTDQVREVIKRGRHMGLPVFPSLKMQSGNEYRSPRCGWLKWEHGAAVCLGEGEEEPWCYDYAKELVRRDKLAMIREMLEDYGADGMELDFMFRPRYFKRAEVEEGIAVMNEFIAAVRALANEVGAAQERRIPLLARVYHRREENLACSLDVETWLSAGHIDYVVGQVSDNLFETGLADGAWLVEAAEGAGAAAYIRPAHIVYDERTIFPHIEMFRALGQTLEWRGFSGMYLGYLPWPFAQREYQILREVAYPEVVERHDKRYLLQPREGEAEATTTPARLLPAVLRQGQTARISIVVADDLDGARRDGEMRPPLLVIRLANFCIEDEIEIRFNGRVLPLEEATITDERATRILARMRSPVDAPESFGGYWLRYALDVELLVRGENVLEVETQKLEETAGFVRSVSGVEIRTQYKDFVRPEGLEVERIAPTAP